MKKPKIELILAILLLFFAVIALFAGDPYSSTLKINPMELSLNSNKGHDKVTPTELAELLIAGDQEYVLVDLRAEEEYLQYFIPGAINISPMNLLNSDLMKNQRIILYSSDDLESGKSWILLKAAKYKDVRILSGGLDGWKNNVLYPEIQALSENKRSKISQISFHFGGQPKSDAVGSQTVSPDLPKIQAPVNVPLSKPKPARKKREGC